MSADEVTPHYVLRGIICYYGRHYWAYFYSQKNDTWLKFDDEHLQQVGSWSKVVERSICGNAAPVILFYERIDIVSQFLTSALGVACHEQLK